jgi:hypothetical protein
MNVKIELEDYDILSSGTIIGVLNQTMIFNIEDLIFELKFINNSETTENKISSILPDDGKKMVLTFENFNNSLGIGNTDPIEVGWIGEQKLFFNYRVYSLTENTGKLLHYTWLLEKKKGAENAK